MRLSIESAFLPTHWPSLGGTIHSENQPCRVNGCRGEATPASKEKHWDFPPGIPADAAWQSERVATRDLEPV